MTKENYEMDKEAERMKKSLNDLARIINDMTVAEQAAWIEWKHGKGAEAAMIWIQNGLFGAGLIPDEDEPNGTDAQAWFDASHSCGKKNLSRLWPRDILPQSVDDK